MTAREKLSDKAIVGLLNSRKGVLALLILTVSTVALFLRVLDSPSYAAIVSIVGTIFMHTQSRTDCAAIGAGLILPPPASPVVGIGDGIMTEISAAIKK